MKKRTKQEDMRMLKKILIVMAAATLAAGFTACSSVQVATTLNGQKLTEVDTAQTMGHLNGDIWGIYLFNLPLFTGSSAQTGRCAIFKDTVQTDDAVKMLTREAKQKLDSTKLVDLTSNRTSTWIFPLLIFWYEDVQVSANAIR